MASNVTLSKKKRGWRVQLFHFLLMMFEAGRSDLTCFNISSHSFNKLRYAVKGQTLLCTGFSFLCKHIRHDLI